MDRFKAGFHNKTNGTKQEIFSTIEDCIEQYEIDGNTYQKTTEEIKQDYSGNGTITFDNKNGNDNELQINGNTYQESYTGKQLLFDNSQHFPTVAGGIDVTFNDEKGTFKLVGSASSTWGAKNITGNILNLTSGTYTFYLKVKGTMSEKIKISILFQDNTYTGSIKSLSLQSNSIDTVYCTNATFTSEDISNIARTRFVIEGLVANSSYDIEIYPMVVKGEYSTATIGEFEKYVGGIPSPTPENPIEIESVGDLITDTTDTNYGKYKIPVNIKSANLFDKDTIRSVSGLTVDENGWLTATYDNSNGTNTKYINIYPTDLDLKEDTDYAIFTEIKNVTGTGTLFETSYVTNAGQFKSHTSHYLTNLKENTIKKDIQRTKLSTSSTQNLGTRTLLKLEAGQSGSITFRLSVLEDTSITVNEFKYQPYYNQTTNIYLDAPLRKIGEYSDYIDFKNKKVVRNIKEVVLNGSERWYKDTTKTITQVFSTYLDTIYNDFICSNFTKNNSQLPYDSEKGAIAKTGSYYQLFLAIKKTTASTTAEFKEWLSNNNTTVDYILATPTETTIDLPNIEYTTDINILNVDTKITPTLYLKSYEQHQSPAPEHPQEIESVGDLANLYNDNAEITRYYIDNDGNEVLGLNDDTFIQTLITNNIAEKYCISYEEKKGSCYVRFAFFNDDGFISRILLTNNKAVVTVPNGTTKIDIRTDRTESQTRGFTKLQIEDGDTSTEYHSYGTYKIPVNVKGANLFNKDDIKILSGVTVDKDGWFTVNYDNSNGTSTVYINVYPTKNLDLKTYTNYNIFTEIKSVSGNAKIDIVSVAYGSGQFSKSISYDFVNLTNNSIVCDINKTKSDWGSTKVGLRTVLRFNAGQSGSITFRLSVLEDTSITVDEFKYQPYYNQTTNIYLDAPLRKIGEYSDYIDFKNKKVVRNVEEYTFKSTDDFHTYGTNVDRYAVNFSSIINNYDKSKYSILKSNRFIYNSAGEIINTFTANYQGYIGFAYSLKGKTTLQDWKDYINSNEVKIIYSLKTPTETTIDLPKIETIKNYNDIEIKTAIEPSYFEIDYKSKIKM